MNGIKTIPKNVNIQSSIRRVAITRVWKDKSSNIFFYLLSLFKRTLWGICTFRYFSLWDFDGLWLFVDFMIDKFQYPHLLMLPSFDNLLKNIGRFFLQVNSHFYNKFFLRTPIISYTNRLLFLLLENELMFMLLITRMLKFHE